jgi:mono/diheme cytochrome c family protein
MKRRLKTVMVTLLAAGLLAGVGGVLFVYSGIYDIAARRPHTRPIWRLLQTAQRSSIEAAARSLEAPSLADAALVRRGLVLYREHCVVCHGAPGEAPAPAGVGMNPNPPPLLTSARDWRAGEIYWITSNGLKMAGMPAFGLTVSPDDLWALTAFVVRMNTLTPETYRQMIAAVAADDPAGAVGAPPDASIDWIGTRDLGWEALAARGDPEAGRRLVGELGCGSCHRVPGVAGARGRLAPPLDGWARRHFLAGRLLNTPADLVPWLVSPQAIKPGSAMPDVGATEAEAWHVARYLYTLQ